MSEPTVSCNVSNCPTCESPGKHLHPAVQHEGEVQICGDPWHTPPPDAQAMTREQVGRHADQINHCEPEYIADHVKVLLDHDAAQRETIRRLEGENANILSKWRASADLNKGLLRDYDALQARLTASEAKRKWTTARPTVKGQYWWRGSTDDKYPEVIPVFLVQGKSELHAQWGRYIALAEGGEWQGPLTPGE